MSKKKWYDDYISQCIREVMNDLSLDCMPTQIQIRKSKYGFGLNNAINRGYGYLSWTQKLNLPSRKTLYNQGLQYENYIKEILLNKGYQVKSMSANHPYDLLINGNVKIDVKSSTPNYLTGSRVHCFGINKRIPTCDLYIACAIDEVSKIEKIMIIPSSLLKVVTLTMGKDSKYNRYIDRWDYIKQYDEFYKSVS